jgi:CheY-like chemotaxis protein
MSNTRYSILVVDDNDINREVVVQCLAGEGYCVAKAAGGHMALALLKAGRFDLVLLDIMMPDLDGYEVLQRIKADPGLRSTPVIMTTAIGEREVVVRCLELGARDYLVKPLNPPEVKSRIWRCLQAADWTYDDAPVSAPSPERLALVVDDDEIHRELLARTVEQAGFTPLCAAGGPEALALLADERIAVALLDIRMPGVDGLEVLEKIRANPFRHALPVIMVSGIEDAANRARCLERGASDYILKPFHPAELRRRLATLPGMTGGDRRRRI